MLHAECPILRWMGEADLHRDLFPEFRVVIVADLTISTFSPKTLPTVFDRRGVVITHHAVTFSWLPEHCKSSRVN